MYGIDVLSFAIVFVIMTAVWIVYRIIRIKKHGGTNLLREILLNVFFIYFIAVVQLTLFKQGQFDLRYGGKWYVNVIPIRETVRMITRYHESMRRIMYNVGGNILLFIPFGFFMPLLFEKMNSIKKVLLYALCFSFTIEFIQYFAVADTSDIDDIIFNCMGAVIGILCYRIFYSIFKMIKCNNLLERIKDKTNSNVLSKALKPILVMLMLCFVFSIYAFYSSTYSAKLTDSELASKVTFSNSNIVSEIKDSGKYKFFLKNYDRYIEVSSLVKVFDNRYIIDNSRQISLKEHKYGYMADIIEDNSGVIVFGKNNNASFVSAQVDGKEMKNDIVPNKCFMVIFPVHKKSQNVFLGRDCIEKMHITFYDSQGKECSDMVPLRN